VDGTAKTACAKSQRLCRNNHVLAKQAAIKLTGAIGRGSNENHSRSVAKHIFEAGVLGHLWILGLEYHCQTVNISAVVNHTHLPRLLIHAARGINSAVHNLHQFFAFHRLFLVLTHTATCHNSLNHRILC
jgi:hypothetical protein